MGETGAEPTRIERTGETGLRILWKGAHESLYDWKQLRAACPCATCREGQLVKIPDEIHPLDIQPVGRYAITLQWSDGHTTGIFSYELLRSLCRCEACQPQQMTEG